MTLSIDDLGERIRQMPVTHPGAEAITARVLRAAQQKPSRALPFRLRPYAMVAAALAVIVGAVYASPALDASVASAAGVGPVSHMVLDRAGVGNGSVITPQDSAAQVSGITVRLTGALADPIRTVLMLKVAPATTTPLVFFITDQFGTMYQVRRGFGDLRTGDWALILDPPSAVAIRLGMRFSTSFGVQGQPGTWTLSGSVLPNQAQTVDAPPAGMIGSHQVTFSSGQLGEGVLDLKAHLHGISIQETGMLRQKGTGQSGPTVTVVTNNNGRALQVTADVIALGDGVDLDIVAYGAPNSGSFQVTITIPSLGSLQRTVLVS